jgi:hypothetical protein
MVSVSRNVAFRSTPRPAQLYQPYPNSPRLADAPPIAAGSVHPTRIALIGGFTPRRCGIATFTAGIHASITSAYPDTVVDVYAMAPVANDIMFPEPVCGVVVENDVQSFRAAADAINASGADVVWLQHEFGLFGGDAGDKVIDLVDKLKSPLIVTLHTVLPEPDADQLRVMTRLIARAAVRRQHLWH